MLLWECVLVVQLCPILCSPMDCNPQGSSVCGISQARRLEWVVIPFSRGSSSPEIEPRSPGLQADFLPSKPPGNPDNNFGNSCCHLRDFCCVHVTLAIRVCGLRTGIQVGMKTVKEALREKEVLAPCGSQLPEYSKSLVYRLVCDLQSNGS